MKRILIQLDTDPIPSVFDRIVAVDAGAEEIFSLGGITPENVAPFVHGAIFTRGIKDLANTAIFVGGSDPRAAETVFRTVNETFIGPLRVSSMLDPNGAATTAAAAVRYASRHVQLSQATALILAGTGPVGQRTALILAAAGAKVRIASRSAERANAVAEMVRNRISGAHVTGCVQSDEDLPANVDGIQLLIAAGAAGVTFLKQEEWSSIDSLKVAIDLNAVPPYGLEGIEPTHKAENRGNVAIYGALGVGGLKMKTHRAAIEKLFSANDLVLDTEAIYQLSETV